VAARASPAPPSDADSTTYPSLISRSVSVTTSPCSSSTRRIFLDILRKNDLERRAPTRNSRDRHCSLVRFDNLLDEAEPQPASFDLRVDYILATIKGLENVADITWGNAASPVIDCNAHVYRCGPRPDFDPTAGTTVFQRIVDQVLKRSDEGGFVRRD